MPVSNTSESGFKKYHNERLTNPCPEYGGNCNAALMPKNKSVYDDRFLVIPFLPSWVNASNVTTFIPAKGSSEGNQFKNVFELGFSSGLGGLASENIGLAAQAYIKIKDYGTDHTGSTVTGNIGAFIYWNPINNDSHLLRVASGVLLDHSYADFMHDWAIIKPTDWDDLGCGPTTSIMYMYKDLGLGVRLKTFFDFSVNGKYSYKDTITEEVDGETVSKEVDVTAGLDRRVQSYRAEFFWAPFFKSDGFWRGTSVFVGYEKMIGHLDLNDYKDIGKLQLDMNTDMITFGLRGSFDFDLVSAPFNANERDSVFNFH